jgi:hypothetical protein
MAGYGERRSTKRPPHAFTPLKVVDYMQKTENSFESDLSDPFHKNKREYPVIHGIKKREVWAVRPYQF